MLAAIRHCVRHAVPDRAETNRVTTDHVLDEAPASSLVLRDLIQLRSRDGITMRKIKDLCPHLQRLTVVRLELVRLQLDAGDLYIAAYETVRCAVRQIVPRTDHRQILAVTLNIDGDRAPDLAARRHRAAAEVNMYSEKGYARLEEEAYVQLAGALLAATRSPCEVDGSQVTLNIQVSLAPERLAEFLNQLTYEPRAFVRSQLDVALLRALPNATRACNEATSDEFAYDTQQQSEALQSLLDGLLRQAWPPYEDDEPMPVFMAESMVQLLRLRGQVAINDNLRVATVENARYPDRLLELGGQEMEDFFTLKQLSLLAFAALVIEVEEADSWRNYLPPPSGVRVLVDA